MKDGRLIVAHQHFPENNDSDFDKVAVRFSSDEGRTWTTSQVVRLRGLPEGMRFPFDPTLVPLPDGRVRLYFTSVKDRTFDEHKPAIYSAVSTNGVEFIVEPGVCFDIGDRPVIDCAVVLHKGVFHLFAPDNGVSGVLGSKWRIAEDRPHQGVGYHAASQDGLQFTRQPDVQIEGRRRWLGNAQSDGTVIRFFGTGDPGRPGNIGGIWVATSEDGQLWKLQEDFAIVPGADPGAVKLKGDGWLVVVTGPPRPGTPSAQNRRVSADAKAPGPEPREVRSADVGRPPSSREEFGRPNISFDSVLTHIPSVSGGEQGIVVRILIHQKPRFAEGTPIVINVPGGVHAGSVRGRPEYVGFGFVEIHFAFPGGGEGNERSGGTYDFRGPNCIRALADVIRFATGRLADKNGKRISNLVPVTKVLSRNCGIVGSSHSGNTCGLAMAMFGHEFPDLAFYASMESPYGEGTANVELGGYETGVNPAYNPATGLLDLSSLAWSPDLAPGLAGREMPGVPKFKGALFFDFDSDGKFSSNEDFPANSFVGDDGQGIKAWYSPRLLAEAEQRSLFGRKRLEHIPSLTEVQEFWRYHDAAGSIAEAIRKCTNLAVIVYAGQRDHVQAAPDHPHILTQVEGFRKAGARFVRLNPDRAYVERLLASGQQPPDRLVKPFCDNDAGRFYDRDNIRNHLEPEGLPITLFMQAAVCELADRVQSKNWSKNLQSVLYVDAPW
jgi:hypothetical protein